MGDTRSLDYSTYICIYIYTYIGVILTLWAAADIACRVYGLGLRD